MCLTFFYINPKPEKGQFSLVLIFNRDEYLNRPTDPASWKEDVLAGRDMEPGKEGGTWLAFAKTGRLAFLTNIYTGLAVKGEGRGFLCLDFVKGNQSPESYMEELSKSGKEYSPFNLFALQLNKNNTFEGCRITRSMEGCAIPSETPSKLGSGLSGIGNHPMSSPYQKTKLGKEAFQEVIESHANVENVKELETSLFEMMCDKTSNYPDPQMEFQGSGSALRPFHKKLSSIFVDMPEQKYGTRMQTFIAVDFDLNVVFVERSRQENIKEWKETRVEFKISKKE